MDLSIQGGMSPEDIISFIQQHTEEYSALIKTEMQTAERRTELMRDLAELASTLERSKGTGDDNTTDSNMTKYGKANVALEAFHQKYPDLPIDLKVVTANTGAAATNHSIDYSTPEHKLSDGVSIDSMNGDLTKAISTLTNCKDQIAGDDKLGMMTLQEDASRMKDLYELGSNLLAKGDQVANALINNIKG